ncbi:class I adenylate-forming enzyme family protein [Afipia carboxidovorans]|uniref:class I adenylate-forming enzyme family protein n=1 Tax=Afipia carboxidovorans TaxID=40137 RepID=UPI0030877025|nr:AMP-binding protein [Afipia carboxidovorans]
MDTVILQFDDDARPSRASASGQGTAPSLEGVDHLGLAFFDVARARGAHPAIKTEKAAFTYDWLLRAAESVRRYLCSREGFASGARVALKLANSPEYVAAFYGTLLADGVVVPLPVALEPQRLQQIEDACRPDILIVPKNLADKTSDVVTLIADAPDSIARPALQRGRDDLAMLLFTSGSTGLPKGVMLSHGNLLANARAILHELPITPDERALVLLPFCHAFGNSILQTHVLAGATMVFAGALMFPATIPQAIAKFSATSFSAVPEVYGMLLKYGGLGDQKMPSLRYMSVAGGGLRHDLSLRVAELIKPAEFYVMYGQSEASARLAVLPPAELKAREGSIGRALDGVALAVMDDAGAALPSGEAGMLCARGPNVMLGYWQDSAATADVLGADGWLRTGDLARRDADGYFYIEGRANLLVKVQGYRVHPAEVESVVEAAFPGVRAVAVPVPHAGDTRFALFVAPQGATVDSASLRATCQKALPPYKVPLHIAIVEELPLTSGYKVDRSALSERAAAALGQPSSSE